jgi:regulator of protease activity HflC (stomatin/prohibitin superfamily)
VLELTAYGNVVGEMASHQYAPSVKIQTSDGYFVDVDVTILYRIEDAYKVITTLGPGARYLQMGLIPRAVPNLKQAYGELTTEDFYNSPMRVKQGEVALELMNNDLNAKGITVDQVLVRYFAYSPEIQKNIEDKKLMDQLVFTNQSKNKAAQAEAELKRVTTEGEMKVKVTQETGMAYKVQKDAERDLYSRKKRAEADLLVQLAEAKRVEYRNSAMQVAGSDMAVAMKMADVLRGLDVVIVPTGGPEGLNPLDLNQVTAMFGMTSDAERQNVPVATPPLALPTPEPEPAPAAAPLAESQAPTTTEVIPDATH